MGFTYLFIFVIVEKLNSPAYPDDFQDIDVKDEPFEYDSVSCDLFYHISLMLFSMCFYLICIISKILGVMTYSLIYK